MNIVKFKGLVASNRITNSIAEWVLDGYNIIHKIISGSYTANREDIIVWEILESSMNKPMHELKYIDIGANHYRRGNNTYLFYKHNASGILVEANPILCNRLQKHRKKDIVVNAAVGEKNQNIPFYILSLPTRSSIDKKHVEESVKKGLYVKEIIDVPCKDLNDLLDEYGFEPDYLSIDIEGMDYRVLRTLDFSKYKVKIIIAEKTNELSEEGTTMDDYMKQQGYEVYRDCGSNVIYRIKEFTEAVC